MNTLVQDLRFGLRMLAKNPGFTAVAVLTLALGIGANTAIFSVVNTVLLRPLPYQDADRLVWITQFIPRQNNMMVFDSTYFAWARRNQVFASIAAYGMKELTLTGRGDATRLAVGRVTAGFFPTLGVTPMLGRNFSADEDRPGGPPVCIVSHTFWQNRLGADASMVGKTINLDGRPYSVLGVLPANFEFFGSSSQPPVYVPFDLHETFGVAPGETHMFPWVIARLKPGVTIQRAESNLALIDRSVQSGFKGGYDKMMEGARAQIMPLHTRVAGDVSRALLVLQVAVGFVLLIACANVANLQLARAVRRTKEIAVRAALGAGRWRMARQLLTESLLLAGLGATVGWALGSGGVSILRALGPAKIPHLAEISLDTHVLMLTVLVSMVTGLAFGLAPALAAAKTQPGEWLKEGGLRLSPGPAGHRLRGVLVVTQLALAMVLLTGAGLLTKSFLRLARTDPGFNSHHLLIAQVQLPDNLYPQPVQQREFFQTLLANLHTLPGVSAAEAVAVPPLRGYMMGAGFQIENRPMRTDVNQAAAINIASPDYFRAIGVPLLSGRSFMPHDSADAPKVAILNHTCARTFFRDSNPVGQRIRIAEMDWVTIVGVTADVRQGGLEFKPLAEIFVPYLQMPYPAMTIVVRTAQDPLSLAGALRSQVQSMDESLPVYGVKTMDQLLTEQVGSQKFNMALLVIFAVLAVVLAAVGIYGVMTYSVAQRTHEIGIRMALGAEAKNVLGLVLRQGLILAGLGVGIGLAGASALTRFIASLLYNVRPNDAATFIAVSLLLSSVALLATYLPARRATKVDPMVALRYE